MQHMPRRLPFFPARESAFQDGDTSANNGNVPAHSAAKKKGIEVECHFKTWHECTGGGFGVKPQNHRRRPWSPCKYFSSISGGCIFRMGKGGDEGERGGPQGR